MAGLKLSWKENVVKNLSKYSKEVVAILVMQSQLSQAKIANAAKDNHGADAHSQGRYESQTGILTQSIQPGKLIVTDGGVSFEVVAAAGYAGYVEGDPSMKSTPIGVFPFMKPAAEEELPYFLARLRQAMEGVNL